jgi:GNAT superfamily N-acetyltransferase
MPELSLHDAEHFTHVDYDNRMALVATVGEGDQERILAVVRYERLEPTLVEVAFVVADEWQGHGIATALLLHLAAYAQARGFTRLVAVTMASNIRMLEVLRHCGYPITIHCEHSEDEVYLDISRSPAPVLALVSFIPLSTT